MFSSSPLSHTLSLSLSFSFCRLWPCLIRCAAQSSKYSRTRTWLARWCFAWHWEASCCWWVQESNYIMFSLPTTDYSSTTFMRSLSLCLFYLSRVEKWPSLTSMASASWAAYSSTVCSRWWSPAHKWPLVRWPPSSAIVCCPWLCSPASTF